TGRSRSTGRSRAAGRDRTAGRDQTAGPDQTGRDRMVGRDETGRDRAGREAPYPANGQRGPWAPGDLRPPGDLRASGEPGRWTDPGRRPPGAPRPDRPAAPPYGRILIFTLLDDRVADFDRLAEQAAEEVQTREPDTLVYVIHLVPNAPMQRIFYEVYRDRAAFDSHENQPYMMRFVADRRACVLATNVIELRLKYAKVAPLPNPQQPGPQQPGPQQPSPYPPGPGRPRPALRPQSLEPLPPRPDRPDRRAPSGDPRYGGI
ncbi:MAG: putative quinol monooxygenase, partial [Streptosporangiaceae bacterium]